jgi:hypothetical protein
MNEHGTRCNDVGNQPSFSGENLMKWCLLKTGLWCGGRCCRIIG